MPVDHDLIVPFDDDELDALRSGEWRPSSSFLSVLPLGGEAPTGSSLIARGAEIGLRLTENLRAHPDALTLRCDDVEVVVHPFDFTLERARIELRDVLDEARVLEVSRAQWAITVTMTLGEPVLPEFHRLLRCVAALVPDAMITRDNEALRWLGSDWIASAAASHAPPAPHWLYSLHAVTGGDSVWFHTHGLLRCGAVEIEAIEDVAGEDATLVAELIRAAALFLIDAGTPPDAEPFPVGRDLELAWRPWSSAIEGKAADSLGGMNDREGHGGLTASLGVMRERRGLIRRWTSWLPLTTYLRKLAGNPLFFMTNTESRRMAQLASERFPQFRELHRFARDKDCDWRFLMKLAYPTDGDGPNEHLWFEVHAVNGAQVDATLLNQPYGIDAMNEGDRDWHAVDQLSDWNIETEWGTFDPDRVEDLVRRAAESR